MSRAACLVWSSARITSHTHEVARRDLVLAQYSDLRSWVPLLMKAAVEKAVYTAYTQQAMRARGPTPDYLQVVRLFEDMAGVRWTHPQ